MSNVDGVDRVAREVRYHKGHVFGLVDAKVGANMLGECLLVDDNINISIFFTFPLEYSEEEVCLTHEVGLYISPRRWCKKSSSSW